MGQIEHNKAFKQAAIRNAADFTRELEAHTIRVSVQQKSQRPEFPRIPLTSGSPPFLLTPHMIDKALFVQGEKSSQTSKRLPKQEEEKLRVSPQTEEMKREHPAVSFAKYAGKMVFNVAVDEAIGMGVRKITGVAMGKPKLEAAMQEVERVSKAAQAQGRSVSVEAALEGLGGNSKAEEAIKLLQNEQQALSDPTIVFTRTVEQRVIDIAVRKAVGWGLRKGFELIKKKFLF